LLRNNRINKKEVKKLQIFKFNLTTIQSVKICDSN